MKSIALLHVEQFRDTITEVAIVNYTVSDCIAFIRVVWYTGIIIGFRYLTRNSR